MNRRLVSVFVAFSIASALLAAQDPKGAAQAQPRPLDFKGLANSAIHVLRAEQGADGSYGGSVKTTGLALLGFARCGRQYREVDGPFVARGVEFLMKSQQKDGAFQAAGDKEPVASSMAAALALDALDAKKYAAAIQGAVAYAGKAASKPAPPNATGAVLESFVDDVAPELIPRIPVDEADARDLLLNGRDEKGGYGDAARTASRLVLINRLAARVAKPAAQEPPVKALPNYDPTAKVDVDAAIRKGVEFLAKRQRPGGEFGSTMTADQWLGVTALVSQALWAYPGEMPKEIAEAAQRATAKVATAARPDGSIHGGGLENYTTSASIGALVASKDPNYRKLIEKARVYITGLQADEADGSSKDHWTHGGFGYGDEERPDLSNTQFALDALVAAGAKANDPALQKALAFLTRCQNRSESNPTEISRDGVLAVAGNDGGGVYYPGKSQAGADKTADGKETPRSYGSMTYALLKGFVLAGLPKDDPRLKAAFDWCRAHYTLERVPGYEEAAKASPRVAYQGLYYYYLTMATALRAFGADTIETPDGKKHDWRAEMAARVISMQHPDGSWANENSARWFEGDELIATPYAILTLKALQR